jgi:hypothetical protein
MPILLQYNSARRSGAADYCESSYRVLWARYSGEVLHHYQPLLVISNSMHSEPVQWYSNDIVDMHIEADHEGCDG